MAAWIKVVNHGRSLADLRSLWRQKQRNSTISLYNVVPPLPGTLKTIKNTVEFRQHASTLQTSPVLSWIDFVVKLIWFCQNNDSSRLEDCIGPEGLLREPGSSFRNVSRSISCTRETIDHYDDQRRGDRGEWFRNLRLKEKLQAQQCRDDPLARLALSNIGEERSSFDIRNIDRRIEAKFLDGGKKIM